MNSMKTTLIVQNLKCGGCAKTITSRLSTLSGIKEVEIDVHTSEVQLRYDTLNDLAMAERLLVNLGYPPEGVENTMVNKAKSFVSCAIGTIN
tara:strand:- start:85834 stop:86109 length:276 start_codon:yes stop_codon:yes gene_type:complete